MKHPVRWSLLSTMAITVVIAWLTRAAGPLVLVASPMPSRSAAAPAPATGSLYPAPQVDESAPPAPPSPTF